MYNTRVRPNCIKSEVLKYIYRNMKKAPLYKLSVNQEDEENGVFAISIVDKPAIKSSFLLFADIQEKKQIIFSDEDKQIITGAALIPDLQIYREDEGGNPYYVTIDAPTIEQVAVKFFKEGYQNNATSQHKDKLNDITYFESWIVENPENDKSKAIGLNDIPKGAWIVSLKVHSKELWNKIKSGDFNGFSIEGIFGMNLINASLKEEKNNNNTMLEQAKQVIKKGFKSVKELFANKRQELKFSQFKLEDGTLIDINETDYTVNTIEADGTLTPLGDGEYILEDGTPLYVVGGISVDKETYDQAQTELSNEANTEAKTEVNEPTKVPVKASEVKETVELSEVTKLKTDLKLAEELSNSRQVKIDELNKKLEELELRSAAKRTEIVSEEDFADLTDWEKKILAVEKKAKNYIK